jgi:hypothetical protein
MLLYVQATFIKKRVCGECSLMLIKVAAQSLQHFCASWLLRLK